MRNKILLFTIILFTSNIFGQSKKEIIESLSIRIDSLNMEIKKRDVKYDQELINNNNSIESLSTKIKKLEINIQTVKLEFDSLLNTNNYLKENIDKLQIELVILKDSINKLNNKLSVNENINLSAGFRKVKSKWEYFMTDFADEKYIVKDSLNKICNDERCVSFLLIDKFLIVSYKINETIEFDTQIIDLISNQDLLSTSKIKIYLEGFDKIKNILLISSEGYDSNGRYWQNGTWSLNEKILKIGKKEY